MLARIRVGVPDRPGSLGVVTSAIGAAGADVARVEVLESERGRAVDDLHVRARDAAHVVRVRAALDALPGVVVLGVQHPAPPTTGHAELELVAALVGRPERALRTLVDGAPSAVGADWAALVRYEGAEPSDVLMTSPTCPGASHVSLRAPLRLTAVSMTAPGQGQPFGGTAVAPLQPHALGLVLVRVGGPAFHRSELWRIGEIGRVAGGLLAPESVLSDR